MPRNPRKSTGLKDPPLQGRRDTENCADTGRSPSQLRINSAAPLQRKGRRREASPTERCCSTDELWRGFRWHRPFAAQARQECLCHSEKAKTHPHTTRVGHPQVQLGRGVTRKSQKHGMKTRHYTGEEKAGRRNPSKLRARSRRYKWNRDFAQSGQAGERVTSSW